MDVEELLSLHGHVLNRQQIVAAGGSDAEIRAAVASGAIRRLRTGWYAWPGADSAICRAISAGGVASCLTALARLGVWVPYDRRVHVRRSRRLRGKRPPAGTVACDLPERRTQPTSHACDTVLVALAAAAGCLTSDHLIVVIDSVLQRKLASREELEQLWQRAPRRVRRSLAAADGVAESGTETLVRLRLLRRGIQVQPQVWIGNKRVDFLIGRRLIIEVDSKRWHLDAEAYENDRARDRELAALGYHVIRLTYQQVINGWDRVEPDLLALVRLGDHLRAPGRQGTRR